MRPAEMAKSLDLAMPAREISGAAVDRHCDAAMDLHLAAIVAPPSSVSRVRERLLGSDVRVCGAVWMSGDPAAAVREVVDAGADEIDLMLNVERLFAADLKGVRDELSLAIRTARGRSALRGRSELLARVVIPVKRLDEKLQRLACRIVESAEADYALAGGAVTVRNVELFRECLPGHIGVGASDTRDLALVDEILAAGAARISSPNAATIMEELASRRAV